MTLLSSILFAVPMLKFILDIFYQLIKSTQIEFLDKIISIFFNSPILPSLMQTIGIALVTILIPLVIFIFEKEKDIFEWDKIVIIDKVIKAKKLLTYISLIFSPLFFWSYEILFFKIILFLIFLYGVINLMKILFNLYYWIKTIEIKEHTDLKNFRNKLRDQYLEEIHNVDEKEKVWISTWNKVIFNTQYELSLTVNFIKNVDFLIQNTNYKLAFNFLQNYFLNLKKRSLANWSIYEILLKKTLEWDHTISNIKETKNIEVFKMKSLILNTLPELTNIAIKNNLSFIYFTQLHKTLKSTQNKKYIIHILNRNFCYNLFDKIPFSEEKYDIWSNYFPHEWKITLDSIHNPDRIISKILLKRYIEWARQEILKNKTEFNAKLDNISSELFPEIDPILWANLFTFTVIVNNNISKSLIEKEINFGYIGRTISGYSDENWEIEFNKTIKKQEENTLKLILLLFPSKFNIAKLNKYISDIQNLGYNDIKKVQKCDMFVKIFEKMITMQKTKKE